MCVIIDRHDLYSVFKHDVALLEVLQSPPDRKPSFHRHFKVVFFFFLSTGEHLKGLQLAGVAQAHGEARFDDVYGCCRHPSDQLAIFSLLFLEEKIITNNL